MNKKVMIGSAIALAVAVIVLLNRAVVRRSPVSQQVAQTNTGAAMVTPKAEVEQVKVGLVGITTVLNVKKALLRVRWPEGASTREESYILSEGESKDGITVDSIDVTAGSVTLRVHEVTRTVGVEKGG